jgi:phosphoribosylglycinamide formyltransferase 2
MRKKILLLGSGELGKELVIAFQRLGQYVIAVDSYANAPAMQVAQDCEVINMLDGDALDAIVAKHQPDVVVPEVESIRTERFYDYESQGIQVVPSARAANFTMNRRAIRDLAAKELGLETAPYRYATSFETLKSGTEAVGMPCVVKPLMSSSGKGQSVIRTEADIEKAWQYALEGSRGDLAEVIVESFIDFDYEITLLTLTQDNGETLFCPPIGHRQERGDYQESWQPAGMESSELVQAQEMAAAVTASLGGNGIWGVEFFIKRATADGSATVYFSELSPRPHDTGMVTLGHTQNFSEFELHARAILGLPVHAIEHLRNGASAVILAPPEVTSMGIGKAVPQFSGLEEAASVAGTDIRLFGKPTIRPYRRMAVALSFDAKDSDVMELVGKAKEVAALIQVDALEIEGLKG